MKNVLLNKIKQFFLKQGQHHIIPPFQHDVLYPLSLPPPPPPALYIFDHTTYSFSPISCLICSTYLRRSSLSCFRIRLIKGRAPPSSSCVQSQNGKPVSVKSGHYKEHIKSQAHLNSQEMFQQSNNRNPVDHDIVLNYRNTPAQSILRVLHPLLIGSVFVTLIYNL